MVPPKAAAEQNISTGCWKSFGGAFCDNTPRYFHPYPFLLISTFCQLLVHVCRSLLGYHISRHLHPYTFLPIRTFDHLLKKRFQDVLGTTYRGTSTHLFTFVPIRTPAGSALLGPSGIPHATLLPLVYVSSEQDILSTAGSGLLGAFQDKIDSDFFPFIQVSIQYTRPFCQPLHQVTVAKQSSRPRRYSICTHTQSI